MPERTSDVATIRKRIGPVVFACIMCVASTALAQRFVVDPRHPQASDHNPGTAARPFSTLNRALRDLGPGETLLFKASGESIYLQKITDGSPPIGAEPGPESIPAEAVVSPAAPEPAGSYRDYLGYLIIAVALVTPLLVYFLWFQPRRKRRPLLEALAIVDRDERAAFPQAEELLTTALIAGLRARDIAMARFTLAYVRARLGRYPEAAAVLSDLMAMGNQEQDTIYLALWLHARQKQHEQVERLYDQHASVLGDLLDTKLIAGITFLRQGRLLWSRRQVSGALQYYERLRELEVLQDQIPSHIADHQIMFGIIALFEKNLEEARKHFSGAVDTAAKEERSATASDLGLLLCRWRSDGLPDIDDDLGKIAATMEKNEKVTITCSCGRNHRVNLSRVGDSLTCKGCKQKLEIAGRHCRFFTGKDEEAGTEGGDSEAGDRPELREEQLLLRNVLLWHAVSLLFTWQSRPLQSGLSGAEKERLKRRLDKVIAVDGEMSDPYLLRGLIGYYFASDDTEKQAALELLGVAQKQGVNLPEVLVLLERERRLAELQRDALQRFLVLVKNYLSDPGVPEHLRQQLRERLQRFSRFKDLGEIDLLQGEFDTAPSLKDIQARGAILHRRVHTIIKPRLLEAGADNAEALEGLLHNLERETQSLAENTDRLEKAEINLMATTGEFLFRDEEENLPEMA